MKIKNRIISQEMPPLIIAEIGINHGGSLEDAKKMVELAAASGCECIKHQTHIIEDEMTNEAKNIFPPNAEISIWEVMKRNALPLSDEVELKKFTEKLGLIYLSTPFSRKAVDFLDSLDVPAFKIGSGESDNLPLLRYIASKKRPVIMSTGMQTINSIRESVKILEATNLEYALLECTNLYPSPPENISLKAIGELKQNFPNAIVGFSDHSIGPEMALASVALGACIVERHFTDSRYRKGPDISCSMDPAELRFLIDKSKEVHKATLKSKFRSLAEEDVYKFARSSVVAEIDLKSGHIIKEQDIWARRPGSGEIPGFEFDKIVGKKLIKNVKKNQQLKWDDFYE